MTGIITKRGPAIKHRGAIVALPKAHTAAGAWIAQLIADIDSGALLPCPYCGGYCGCGCDWWIEAMEAQPNADPHDDLSAFANVEIPF